MRSLTNIPNRLLLQKFNGVYNNPKIFFHWIYRLGHKRITLDKTGIPVVNYGGSIGKQRNPVTISQKAMFYEAQYKSGNIESKQLFMNCADWLVNNSCEYEGFTIWEYYFPWGRYNLPQPWRSAMAQGQGIQVLCRAYTLMQKRIYLEVAQSALQSLFVEVKEGGVTHKGSDGWWYEEYAHENGYISRVLNGMMFTLLGVYEYYKVTLDEKAGYLFNMGILALKNHLSDYDEGTWTYYDILGNLASNNYHNIHISQLYQIYLITLDTIFLEYHDKWSSYL